MKRYVIEPFAYCWFCLGMCCMLASGLIAGKYWFNERMEEVFNPKPQEPRT